MSSERHEIEEVGVKRTIRLRVPDNWHCHFRQALLLIWMVKMLLESGFRGRVLAMPNTKPEAVLIYEDAERYKAEIDAALSEWKTIGSLVPVMTIQITETTTRAMIRSAYQRGVGRAKVYPRYVTTNSENGVVDYTKIYPALAEAEKLGMIVCFHCEHPSYDIFGLLKEEEFIAILEEIREKRPRLKIVVEHISTWKMIEWVKRQPVGIVGATLTVQHMAMTLDDVIGYSRRSGGLMRVHSGFKPQPKHPDDRRAIQEAALLGDPHFFYGGDDAPHLRSGKECDGSACGAFITTVALPYLIQLFDEAGVPDRLDPFLSGYGPDFHGYPRTEEFITFEESDWIVPLEYPVPGTGEGVVSLFAGETMHRKIVSR